MSQQEEPYQSPFDAAAAEERRGILGEFWDFLSHNKKWWLLPIVLTVLALGALLVIGGTGFAPFIYTLF